MNKTKKRFFGSLIVLLLFIFGFYLLFSGKIGQESPKLALPTVKKELVDKVVLIDSQKTLSLTKKNNQWSLDVGGNVDQTKISSLLDLILSIDKSDLVSTNKDRQSQFGMGLKKIEVYMGKSKSVIEFGKNFNLSNVYYRINDEDKTYSTNNKADDYFDTDFLVVKTQEPTPVFTPKN